MSKTRSATPTCDDPPHPVVNVRTRHISRRFANIRIHYGLTNDRLNLARKDAIVLHPGPMNRGIEIASDVADSSRSLILDQVKYGVTS